MLSAANKKTDQPDKAQSSAESLRGDTVQAKASTADTPVPASANRTGLPDNLKAGIETLSGYSLNDVQVHYNSSMPAQLQAHAYAQGTDIHVAPGQERHLPHEAWHVVQQKQGRVKPTRQLKGKLNVNDHAGLEQEADQMGAKAIQMRADTTGAPAEKTGSLPYSAVIQRRVGMEYETNIGVQTEDGNPIGYHVPLFTAKSGVWKIEADSSSVEFVTEPFDTTKAGGEQLMESVTEIMAWASAVEKVTVPVSGNDDKAFLENVAPEMGAAQTVEGQKVIFPDKSITSAGIISSPQATGGVTLDKIPLLFEMALKTELPHLSNPDNGYKAPWKIEKPKTEKPTLEKVKQQYLEDESNPVLQQQLKAEFDDIALKVGVLPDDEIGINEEEDSFDEEAMYEELLQGALESYEHELDFYQSQTKPLESVGLNVEKAPYTLSGMNSVDQPSLAISAMLAADAIKKLDTKEADFGKLQGLLTLIFSYMITGSQQGETYKYSKQIAPIMSRTNIKRLYEQLDEEEKKVFTPEFVLKAVQLEDGDLFQKGFGKKEAPSEGPSRSDWIQSIIDGTPNAKVPLKNKLTVDLPFSHSQLGQVAESGLPLNPHNFNADLLSRDSRSPVVKNYNIDTEMFDKFETSGASSSMGEQNALDVDKEDGSNLVVLELRRLPREQRIKDWLHTADVVFRTFMDIKHAKK